MKKTNLSTIPTNLFDNMEKTGSSKVKTFQNAYLNCSSLSEVPNSLFDNIGIKDITKIYYGWD